MDHSFYLLWWICCLVYSTYSAEVIRKKLYDDLIPKTCIDFKLCEQYKGKCTESAGVLKGKSSCCQKCSCQIGKKNTFYKKNYNPSCVENPNTDDDCKYNFGSNTGSTLKGLQSFKVPPKEELNLGKLNHREAMLFSYKCLIRKRQFWNLVEWKDFDEGKYFKIIRGTADHDIKLRIPKKNKSLFEGYLIKLKIECTKSGEKNKLDSCLIFKMEGSRKYKDEPKKKIVQPTLPLPTVKLITTKKTAILTKATTKGPTIVKKQEKKKDILIIVVIAVSVAIFLVVSAILTWWCCRRRTKKVDGPSERELLRPGEDPNYQHTDRFPVRHSTEIHDSANNLTYLQPVDAGLPRYNGSSRPKDNRRNKDHNYDYPDVNRFSKKSHHDLQLDSVEKPIYAEVSELRKPDPEYSDPETIMKSRGGTQVVGVPGYQPPSGIFCDDSKSTYSSLGVLSSDGSTGYQSLLDPKDSVKSDKGPKYHVVEPEATEIEV